MSQPLVKTPDTGYIVSVARNGYGDATEATQNVIQCAFFEQFNRQQATNEEMTQSDAYVYLDTNNAFIKGLGYKIQGYYFKINTQGVDQWYTITTVQVAQRKLLTNEVNNVLCTLQVTASPIGAV